MSALHKGLLELEHLKAEADTAYSAARVEYERSQLGAVDLVAQLREYDQGVAFKKPNCPADPDKHRAITTALCRAIMENKDLVFSSLDAAKVRIDDLGPERRKREAAEQALEASRTLSDFRREHAVQFAAEAKAAEQEALKAALADGDPETIRTALGLNEDKSSVLTTADLAG